jgi:hypothetical protein
MDCEFAGRKANPGEINPRHNLILALASEMPVRSASRVAAALLYPASRMEFPAARRRIPCSQL